MKINKNSWHYKVYQWFKGNEPTVANLCPYCRTVFLWAPLKFLFAKGWIKKIPVPAVIYPVLFFEVPRWAGMLSYDFKMGVYLVYRVAATILFNVGLLVLTSWLLQKLRTKKLRSLMTDEEWFRYDQHDRKKGWLPVRLQKRPFWERVSEAISNSLIWNYLKAKHDRICPIIYFEEEQNDTTGSHQSS